MNAKNWMSVRIASVLEMKRIQVSFSWSGMESHAASKYLVQTRALNRRPSVSVRPAGARMRVWIRRINLVIVAVVYWSAEVDRYASC